MEYQDYKTYLFSFGKYLFILFCVFFKKIQFLQYNHIFLNPNIYVEKMCTLLSVKNRH